MSEKTCRIITQPQLPLKKLIASQLFLTSGEIQLTFGHDIEDNHKTFRFGSEFWIGMIFAFLAENEMQRKKVRHIFPFFEQNFITLQFVILSENIVFTLYWAHRL